MFKIKMHKIIIIGCFLQKLEIKKLKKTTARVINNYELKIKTVQFY